MHLIGIFKDVNFHAGVCWTTWALPLELHLEPRRPWPTIRVTVGPFYASVEWWRGSEITEYQM